MNQGLKLDMLWQVGYRKGVNNLGKFEAQLSHLTPEKIWPDLNSLVSHLFIKIIIIVYIIGLL